MQRSDGHELVQVNAMNRPNRPYTHTNSSFTDDVVVCNSKLSGRVGLRVTKLPDHLKTLVQTPGT